MNKKATLFIFTYNQENFIEDAIAGALSQTYSPLEIIVSDDCSSDHTYERIVNALHDYNGPHEIKINKNENNMGIREHCNKILYELATGEYIFVAAGDDISAPNRVEECVNIFEKFPEVMSISCRSLQVDKELNDMNSKDVCTGQYSILTLGDYCAYKDFIIFGGDSRAIRKTVVDSFPRLQYPLAEDIFLFVRSLMLGPCCYIRKPLVRRRHWEGNVSARKLTSEIIELEQLQFKSDINYAYEHKYISLDEKKILERKCDSIRTIFSLYWVSKKENMRARFYQWLKAKFRLVRMN